MREKRNAILIVIFFLSLCYAFWAWFFVTDPETNSFFMFHRLAGTVLFIGLGMGLIWYLFFEDKLPDILAKHTGGIYYERGGLCFMPVMRKQGGRAYLCIYFENRYDNPCQVVIHLRPPKEAMQHRPDATDIHFAFQCSGGAVGIIHQPVAVHPQLQGQVIDVKLAAAVNYPHNRGQKMRSHKGMACGTFEVDWGVNFRTGIHELSGEIELHSPATIRLPIPRDVSNRIKRGEHWHMEPLSDEKGQELSPKTS